MAAQAISYTAKTRIVLGGYLLRKYGREHNLVMDRRDPREAERAMDANYPGFARDVADAESKGLRFAVFKNGKNIGERDLELGGARELRFVPVVAGSRRGGVLQTILGVVLIVASFSVAPGSPPGLLAAGIGTTAGGVIQMLSSQERCYRRAPPRRTCPASGRRRTRPPAVIRYRSASGSGARDGRSSRRRSTRRTRLKGDLGSPLNARGNWLEHGGDHHASVQRCPEDRYTLSCLGLPGNHFWCEKRSNRGAIMSPSIYAEDKA